MLSNESLKFSVFWSFAFVQNLLFLPTGDEHQSQIFNPYKKLTGRITFFLPFAYKKKIEGGICVSRGFCLEFNKKHLLALEAHLVKLSSIETCKSTKMLISYYNVFNLGFRLVVVLDDGLFCLDIKESSGKDKS